LTNDRKILRECPLCGGIVELDRDDPLLPDALLHDESEGLLDGMGRVDRVVSALCGCFVLQMDDNAIGRLLACVLALDAGSDEPPGG